MLTGSWIITEKATGKVVAEIFNINYLPLINHEKYKVETSTVGRLRTTNR